MRRAKDEAIIREAEGMTEGVHYPKYGAEYRPGHHAYTAQCAGCTYWTGFETKTKAAKMILDHCRAKANDPGMSELEIAEARLAGLRKDRKHIGGRGSARKKANLDPLIRYWEQKVNELRAAGLEVSS